MSTKVGYIEAKCPFYLWGEHEKIHCEGGSCVVINDREANRDFRRRFCEDVDGWGKCPIAQAMNETYERKDQK